MSRYIFLFDLDSTITRQEILPTIAREVGIYEQMCALTESSMRGEVPFKQSFQDVFNIVDKDAVIRQMVLPFVAVGDGNNDAEMIEAAEVGIGYGGVRPVAPSVLECATHVVYQEDKLVDFLNKLA